LLTISFSSPVMRRAAVGGVAVRPERGRASQDLRDPVSLGVVLEPEAPALWVQPYRGIDPIDLGQRLAAGIALGADAIVSPNPRHIRNIRNIRNSAWFC
jgi:hypothetical protein